MGSIAVFQTAGLGDLVIADVAEWGTWFGLV